MNVWTLAVMPLFAEVGPTVKPSVIYGILAGALAALVLGLTGASGWSAFFVVAVVTPFLWRAGRVQTAAPDTALDELSKFVGQLERSGPALPGELPESFTGEYARVAQSALKMKKMILVGAGHKEVDIAEVEAAITRGLDAVNGHSAEVAATITQLATTSSQIKNNVESLAKYAEESESSILEMAAINDEMAENIQELSGAVEETAASIEEMIYSIKEVAKNIEDLSLAAEQTSTSMSQMEASIGQVQQNATSTATLAEDVIRDAEKGADAVKRTLSGILEIRASSKVAGDVIRQLGIRIGAIDNILTVIDDVAEQTNLLALNAAIIAAQSGEHGRGFAVVADEIKDLAERTGASTKEIAALIRDIQDESQNAIAAIKKGERSVEFGVQLSQAAEGALQEIVQSANASTDMVKAIAQATVEQSKGSKVVADAVERIARTVQQVAAATAEQARGSEQIMNSAERMKNIATHVELSSQEQARGGKQVTASIDFINDMVRQLHGAHGEQSAGASRIEAAFQGLQDETQQGFDKVASTLSDAS